MVRYCDDCPWYYSNAFTESCGCILFGEESKNCKKFDEEVGGCYYSQKKLERMAYALKKKWNHAQKMDGRYCEFSRKPHTEEESVSRGLLGKAYPVVGGRAWYCKNYMPNRKGGHRHNHIYNVCHRITFRSKSARHRVSREDKRFFTATFYTSLKHNLVTLSDILKRRKAR